MLNEQTLIARIGSPTSSRMFSLNEAEELMPMIIKLTQRAVDELAPVQQTIATMLVSDPRLAEVEQRYEFIVRHWVGKMNRLGALVKDLWRVDFDTGDGYLSWKYPEITLSHYYSYNQEFSARQPLSELVSEFDPDWAQY